MATETHSVRNQYFATVAANLVMLGQGLILGWVAPALPTLASQDTPLVESGPLSNEQLSWIGSINCIGSLVGSVAFGYVTASIGCKRATLLLAIPSIAFWLLIHFGINYYYILFANFCGGWVTGGSASTIVLYISEIANDNIRGRLGSLPLFFRNVGILIAYIIGATVDYKFIPWICVTIPIVFVIIFVTLSNTPQYYLRRGNLQKAEDALKHYKGFERSKRDPQELSAFHAEFERLKTIALKQQPKEKLIWADFSNWKAINGLGVGIALVTITQFTASFPIVSYAVTIFENAGTTFNPYVSSIISAVSFLLGSLHTAYLIEALGRKLLTIISLVGAALGLFAMSLYLYLKIIGFSLSAFAWTPIVCISLVIFLSAAGITPVSIICSVEYLPSKIRTFGMSIISMVLSITGFVSVKTFPVLMELVGLHGSLLIYGIGCVVGVVFVIIVLEETRGQSLDDDDSNETRDRQKGSSNKAQQPLIS
ncbi:facilitated trehalose transporter Tret1-2 homolog [Bradysia coprophila]|uniref:facilitated trehalose transporter Tret1-2 homolog n=1 Tax=Bradysia coprophila TaxID=38358 RepID=UPI00187DC748|nr:facilitated trehalose transporter Tret1-2 homolog [Bradysia coprophila]